MANKVLVIGGAGYVGSSVCAWLIDRGHEVHVLDDLSTGHLEHVLGKKFFFSRVGNASLLARILTEEKYDCLMHFAAKCLVSESVIKPKEYFENNVEQTHFLLDALISTATPNRPPRLVFSSTCAIFGDPGNQTISENLPKNPMNPYGKTKLAAEGLLENFARDRGLQAIALRYFNAAGTEPKLRVGERHDPETHLIPNALKAALHGTSLEIYGTDYGTPDGTCIRDYVHVCDLAAAHEAAMKHMLSQPAGGRFEAFNIGSEKGYSVRQVISACERISGRTIQIIERSRRPGDPPMLVANSSLAKRELDYSSSKTSQESLEQIISSAWEWEKKQVQPKKAIFLDRDGTINLDPGYLSHPDQLKLIPGAGEALAMLKRAGFQLIVVSNQSGIGRGIVPFEMLPLIHQRMNDLLSDWGVRIDHFENCIHCPEDNCECRKPKPKLLLASAHMKNIDIRKSYMVGDKIADVQAGRAAGTKAVALVRTGEGLESEKRAKPSDADFIGDSLIEVAHWILDRENASRL